MSQPHEPQSTAYQRSRNWREVAERHQEHVAEAVANPAQHPPRLITSGAVRSRMHRENSVGRFNNWLALNITRTVGTMWCAYLFLLISLVSFPQALMAFLHGDTVVGISWLSQSFLQLVLLPIIIVGQNVISAAQDARALADHETLTILHTINLRQLRLLEEQEQILKLLRQKAET